MMRTDAKVAIAYGSNAMRKVAEGLCAKLKAYQQFGYPVSVSIVAEDIEELEKHPPAGKSVDDYIREKMEHYFSDFDYAIFLFDERGVAIPEGETEKTPLVSSNLIFEYGLASSAFINQELKYIYCFAPKEISGNSLQYVKNLNFKYFYKLLKDKKCDVEAITDMIIQDYIHYNSYTVETDGQTVAVREGIWFSFYGLPKKLPKLTKDASGGYSIAEEIKIIDPMDAESAENKYWADMCKLQPSGVRVALDDEDEDLSKLFKTEYKRFGDAQENLSRRLLYIVDRAVFIMYLRQENYWDDIVFNGYEDGRGTRCPSLYKMRKEYIASIGVDEKDDYYIKAIKALHGVFMYQRLSRPPIRLYGADSTTKQPYLNILANLLSPASNMGASKANRMVYCLATDYLALIHHKQALKALGAIIGRDREYYLDNSEDYNLLASLLSDKAKSKEKASDLKNAIEHFSTAAKLFDDVAKCQEMLQNDDHNEGYRYIWKSYALYNQARCEFMIHLIESLAHNVGSSKYITEASSKLALNWEVDMRASVESRQEDYMFFKGRILFPGFITFNLQAEYYHAFYEYELSSLIELKANPAYKPRPFLGYEKFQDWKDANLTITDVLAVDGKVARLSKLKDAYFDAEIASLLSSFPDEETRKKVVELLQPLKKAAVAEDEAAYDKTTKGFEAETRVGIEYVIGLLPKLTGEFRGKFFYSREATKKAK
jgi:hypothetical protein